MDDWLVRVVRVRVRDERPGVVAGVRDRREYIYTWGYGMREG